MREQDIDSILKSTADRQDLDPALMDRIARKVAATAAPVRRLAPRRTMAGGLLLACASVATMGVLKFGVYGFPKLSGVQIAAIFPAILALTWFLAITSVDQMTPGSKRYGAPGWLVTGGTVVLATLFAALFHDYHTVRFVPAGIACLKAGVTSAIPVALISLLLMRRGYFVHPVAAGFILGALGGLAGLTMLEIHCPNFQALHVIVWHTAVVPVSSGLGGIVGWAARFLLRKRTAG